MRGSERGISLRKVGAAVAVFYIAATLFNAPNLYGAADLIAYGWKRDVALSLTRPLADVSRVLWLDRPRAVLEELAAKAGWF